ncbi:unnamed protein product [Symbiodinium sp. CCMP2456]|nr:unnamed protein product [Symbiodinium sp. CCMP2456]
MCHQVALDIKTKGEGILKAKSTELENFMKKSGQMLSKAAESAIATGQLETATQAVSCIGFSRMVPAEVPDGRNITSPRAEQSAVLVAGDVAFTPQQVPLGPKYEARVPGSNKQQDCVQAVTA